VPVVAASAIAAATAPMTRLNGSWSALTRRTPPAGSTARVSREGASAMVSLLAASGSSRRSMWPLSTCLVASRSSASAARWTPVTTDRRQQAGRGEPPGRLGRGAEQVAPGLGVQRVHQGLDQPQRARRGRAVTGVGAGGRRQGTTVTLNHALMVTAESMLRTYCLDGLPLKDSLR
jgi:hypothetical protein